eukprot:s11092_g1.t1
MEVDAEPVLAQGGIVTPPANPGPEYSPDLASESSQDKQESTRVLPSFAAGPSKKEPLEEAAPEQWSSGLANAELVASTRQATQPRSPPAGTSPHGGFASAQGSAQEGKPPKSHQPGGAWYGGRWCRHSLRSG